VRSGDGRRHNDLQHRFGRAAAGTITVIGHDHGRVDGITGRPLGGRVALPG
jgi:hypothetical protein